VATVSTTPTAHPHPWPPCRYCSTPRTQRRCPRCAYYNRLRWETERDIDRLHEANEQDAHYAEHAILEVYEERLGYPTHHYPGNERRYS
jgi:phage terminase large subunit GpA-like protein